MDKSGVIVDNVDCSAYSSDILELLLPCIDKMNTSDLMTNCPSMFRLLSNM